MGGERHRVGYGEEGQIVTWERLFHQDHGAGVGVGKE